MIDRDTLRNATEDDVEAALAGSYVESDFVDTDRTKLLELYNRMLDRLIGARGEDD